LDAATNGILVTVDIKMTKKKVVVEEPTPEETFIPQTLEEPTIDWTASTPTIVEPMPNMDDKVKVLNKYYRLEPLLKQLPNVEVQLTERWFGEEFQPKYSNLRAAILKILDEPV
jgi:hypothetical protein